MRSEIALLLMLTLQVLGENLTSNHASNVERFLFITKSFSILHDLYFLQFKCSKAAHLVASVP